ncbi:MAG: DNA alkylation repair protein [Candidatus Thorarchaeota archaeon]
MIRKITQEIIEDLKITAPKLTLEQKTRRNKIINSDNPNFISYGHKVSDIEKLTKACFNKFHPSYEDSLEVFKILVKSNVHEEKFAAIFFLNCLKVHFDESLIDIFENAFIDYCDTWAFCDTSCIRVLGPFLAKKFNQALAKLTLAKWSNSEYLWVRRASLVILLKIIMVNKDYNDDYVYNFIEKLVEDHEIYIQKGIGWLLKTCSKYKPNSIFNYLMSKRDNLPRLILRYASEKLSKERREIIFG